jgi:hypothetical protein
MSVCNKTILELHIVYMYFKYIYGPPRPGTGISLLFTFTKILKVCMQIFCPYPLTGVGRDSAVGIATGYGLDE